MRIPFVKAPLGGEEEKYLLESFRSGFHGGNGPFTKKCHMFLENKFILGKALLTTSCTDALEMAGFLVGGGLGDEFIVPSYTFSSTANAFVSRGMTPVFCDIRKDTLNIDETKIEELITDKTKAIVPIHYAGIPAEMDSINSIAAKYGIPVIEDAAQAVNSKYKTKFAGNLSDIGTYSFHATKSYSAGEGGALTLNNDRYFERSEYLWEKGTDRSLVIKGMQNKYSWVDHGSSFLPSDILAALLYSQLLRLDEMQDVRKKVHHAYMNVAKRFQRYGLSMTYIPDHVETNYHAFWILFQNPSQRDLFLTLSLEVDFNPYIGYMPLHSSPMGESLGGDRFDLPVTEHVSSCIARLPFYLMTDEELNFACEKLDEVLTKVLSAR
jgi:dTDP-4-amino-4,6-dideoxygalactose transaminase